MKKLKTTFFLGLAFFSLFTSCGTSEDKEKRIAEEVKKDLKAEEAKKRLAEALTVSKLRESFKDFAGREVMVTGVFNGLNMIFRANANITIIEKNDMMKHILVYIPELAWQTEMYQRLRKNEEEYRQQPSQREAIQITVKGIVNVVGDDFVLEEASLVAYEN